MYFKTELPDNSPLKIVMSHKNEERLAETCFRGCGMKLAGNSSEWNSAFEFFCDRRLRNRFIDHVKSVIESVDDSQLFLGSQRVTVDCRRNIGWASTAPRDDFSNEALEEFWPNRRTIAQRVKIEPDATRAPRTDRMTIVYTLRFKQGEGWLAFIGTMYPGIDIGRLEGNITKRRGIVFFDWQHPGA